MKLLSILFGQKKTSNPSVDLNEEQKATIEKLLEALKNEYDIEGRIEATNQLIKLKNYGNIDVVAALSSAAKHAVMQWESKKMGVAMMHGVSPDRIEVQPHADDSRVTIAVVNGLRKLAGRKDNVGKKSKDVLIEIKKSIKSSALL